MNLCPAGVGESQGPAEAGGGKRKSFISCGSPVELRPSSEPVTADEGLHILRTKVGLPCV